MTVDGFTYDIARARAERYARPVRCRTSRPAGIEEDLRRRDFTVNAIATALGGERAGERDRAAERPRGPPGAAAAECSTTELHRRSDAAAAAGALRSPPAASRSSRARASSPLAAVDADALRTVSGPRIGTELRLSRVSPTARGARDGSRAGVDRAIHPSFGARPTSARSSRARAAARATAAATWSCSRSPRERCRRASCAPLLDRLGFAAAERDVDRGGGCAAVDAWPHARAARDAVGDRARRAGAPLEAGGAGGRAGPERPRAGSSELRHVRLEITGDDLLAAGVPEGPGSGAACRRAGAQARRALAGGRPSSAGAAGALGTTGSLSGDAARANALAWDGAPATTRSTTLTLTDPATGTGVWIRYTMVAPVDGGAGECALWLLAMTRAGGRALRAQADAPDRRAARRGPTRSAAHRRGRADRPRDGAASSTTCAWELPGSRRRGTRARAPARCAGPGWRGRCCVVPHADLAIDGTGRPAGGESLSWTARGRAGARLGLRARASAGRGCTATTSTTLGGRARRTRSSTASRCSCRARRPRGRAGHAGRRADRRRRSSARPSPLQVLADAQPFGLTGWHVEAQDGEPRADRRGRRPRGPAGRRHLPRPRRRARLLLQQRGRSMRLHVWTARRAGAGLDAARDAPERGARALRDGPAEHVAGPGAADDVTVAAPFTWPGEH